MKMAAGLRVGICSWTDKTLLRSGFYPAAASTPAKRLEYYASCFSVVEVDSSYYSIPAPREAFRWVAGTPEGFAFGVKSFATFTWHRTKFSSLPGWLREELGGSSPDKLVRREDLSHEQRVRLFGDFLRPVEILRSAGKLAYVLFQFPPGWVFGREPLIYFKRVREMAGPLPIAVEVRNRSWFDGDNAEKFIRALAALNIAYVAVDEPAGEQTVPPEWPVSARWGTVVRFHGRNAPAWKNPRATVHEKFDYEYAAGEIGERAKRTLAKAEGLEGKIFLMFNNCVSDKAVRGARLMSSALGLETRVSGFQKNLINDPVQ
jgi:uncharacterized protein YecE (DUF72 family)